MLARVERWCNPLAGTAEITVAVQARSLPNWAS
jgi:hypothetical protein